MSEPASVTSPPGPGTGSEEATAAPRHVALIDGSGFLFRAFHALPPLTRPDGTPVNAVFGFCSMLMRLIQDSEADYIAVIFDAGRRTFRNDIFAAYKANRPEPPEELIPQFPLVRDATRAFNVACVELEGFEADDLIASYARAARAAGAEVEIVSSDKDLMQLVGDGVYMTDPIKNRRIGVDEVVERFGVPPEKVVEVQALAGDSTDNVPGVPGIGVKTAAQLITEYGDLETLLASASAIKQPKRRQSLIDNAELARVSRRLVELDAAVDLPAPLSDFAVRVPDAAVLLAFLREQAFGRLIERVEETARKAGTTLPAPPPKETDTPTSYTLVQDIPALDAWIAEAYRTGILAIDTETTSLDAVRAELIGVSLATAAGRACYIPLGHTAPPEDLLTGDSERATGSALLQIDRDAALERLRPLLAEPGVLKIGQNIKYDMVILARHGVAVSPVDDTMLLSYVLDGGRATHGMDDLAQRHLGHTTIKYQDVTGRGRQQIPFSLVPLEAARDYAAEDADVTFRLHRVLRRQLREERLVTVYETIERPLPPVIAAMERAGIRVDVAVLRELSRDFGHRMGDLEGECHALAGHAFNLASPKQLGEILFDEMGLEGGRKGKTGAYGTGADVLDTLAAQGHELPRKLLDWRQLAKLKSTYTDALAEAINPETGRVHTSYAMAVASTGRLSSTDPNLQNIPIRTEEGRRIRAAFVAEPGHQLLSVDYSQIELRLVAEIGGIQALKEAFSAGHDIHAMTASQVFGIPLAEMDPVTRRKAKAINFGIIYGISAFGLARQLDCSPKDADTYIKAYFERYPGIRDYMDRTKVEARETGWVETLHGRRCHVPGINDKNQARRRFAERQAINAPIQGSAADIIKRAMIRIPAALDAAGLAARMLLQVHDELLFEVPDGEVEATSAVVRRVMEAAPEPAVRLSVPLIADAGAGATWAAAH